MTLTVVCHLVTRASFCLKSKFVTGITEGNENILLAMKGSGRPEHSVYPSLALEINSLPARGLADAIPVTVTSSGV